MKYKIIILVFLISIASFGVYYISLGNFKTVEEAIAAQTGFPFEVLDQFDCDKGYIVVYRYTHDDYYGYAYVKKTLSKYRVVISGVVGDTDRALDSYGYINIDFRFNNKSMVVVGYVQNDLIDHVELDFYGDHESLYIDVVEKDNGRYYFKEIEGLTYQDDRRYKLTVYSKDDEIISERER